MGEPKAAEQQRGALTLFGRTPSQLPNEAMSLIHEPLVVLHQPLDLKQYSTTHTKTLFAQKTYTTHHEDQDRPEARRDARRAV